MDIVQRAVSVAGLAEADPPAEDQPSDFDLEELAKDLQKYLDDSWPIHHRMADDLHTPVPTPPPFGSEPAAYAAAAQPTGQTWEPATSAALPANTYASPPPLTVLPPPVTDYAAAWQSPPPPPVTDYAAAWQSPPPPTVLPPPVTDYASPPPVTDYAAAWQSPPAMSGDRRKRRQGRRQRRGMKQHARPKRCRPTLLYISRVEAATQTDPVTIIRLPRA